MTTVQYKSGARRDIESQGYRIIANVGDQYSDLAGGHAQRAFKLANPFYFLP
jgi:HAD superfamily, subfamily IIIB (Acid phosphatase)